MAVAVDTLKFLDILEKAQVPREQARAIVQVVRESHDSADVATKGDMTLVRSEIALVRSEMATKDELADARGDVKLLKWMMGSVLAGILALVLKTFF